MSVQENFIITPVLSPESTLQKRFVYGNIGIDQSSTYIGSKNFGRIDTFCTICSNQTFFSRVKNNLVAPTKKYGSNVCTGSVKPYLSNSFREGLYMVLNVFDRVLISHRSIDKTFM